MHLFVFQEATPMTNYIKVKQKNLYEMWVGVPTHLLVAIAPHKMHDISPVFASFAYFIRFYTEPKIVLNFDICRNQIWVVWVCKELQMFVEKKNSLYFAHFFTGLIFNHNGTFLKITFGYTKIRHFLFVNPFEMDYFHLHF